MSASQPPASEQYRDWKKYPNTYSKPTDEQWAAELAALREELKQWTQYGIVEIAARNPQVMEWIKHHEERTDEAERKLAEAVSFIRVLGEEVGSQGDREQTLAKVRELQRQLAEAYDSINKANSQTEHFERLWYLETDKVQQAERRGMQRAANLLAALESLVAVARRYVPDYDEHPEIQKADGAIRAAADQPEEKQ